MYGRIGSVDWIRKGNVGLILDVEYGGRSVKVVGVGVNSAQWCAGGMMCGADGTHA